MSALIRPTIETYRQQDHALELTWSDGKSSRYHYIWLRDNCASVLHPDTRERVFNLLDISPEIHPLNVSISDNELHIEWSEQNHHSHYSGDWLRDHAYCGQLTPAFNKVAQSWDQDFIKHALHADYQTLIDDDQALYEWMQQLDRDGLTFVSGMPSTEQALTDIAHRIDYQRQTNFGITFEVKNNNLPNNLAYTSLALPLHTDLPNQETPPGYQFLHCLINQNEGGESLFVDGLKVLEDLREQAPEHFQLLAYHPIPFRFHDDQHDIMHHHPVIQLDHRGNITELKFNAHLADVFDLPEAIMHDYYVAYRDLMARMQDKTYIIKLTLKTGMMAVFDNRRILHGRAAFDPRGERHLRGCYVDRTEFKSRLRILSKRFGAKERTD